MGEGFLRAPLGTLQILRTEVEQTDGRPSKSEKPRKTAVPFIYEYFRVQPFYQPNCGTAELTTSNLLTSKKH